MKAVGKATEDTNKDLSLQEVTLKGIARQQAKVTQEARKAARASRLSGVGSRIAGGFNLSGIRDGMSRTRRAASSTFRFIGRAARRAAGVGAAGFAAMGLAINKAAEREKLTQTFSVLLGSVDAASKRIEELTKFSVETPFEMEELAKANRLLQVFGGEALGSIDVLRQLGDVAGATNNDFESLAFWFGRIIATTKSGVIDGEALRRLQEMGILSHEARKEMEKMGKTRDVAKVMDVWRRNTERFNGGMKLLSRTMSGLTSTFKTEINESLVQFGQQLLPGAKKSLDSLIDRIREMRQDGTFVRWGQETSRILGRVGENIAKLFGSPQERQQATDALAETVRKGVEKSIAVIEQFMPQIVEKIAIPIGAGVARGIGEGVTNAVAETDTFRALGDASVMVEQSARRDPVGTAATLIQGSGFGVGGAGAAAGVWAKMLIQLENMNDNISKGVNN